jgi:hypothetical protein
MNNFSIKNQIRDFLELPSKVKKPIDYGIREPISGYDYLSVPEDDIRWQYSITAKHPPSIELPIVFFEILAQRFSKTTDFDKFIKKIPLPIVLRSYFEANPNLLPPYLSKVFLTFPAIIARAGYLYDQYSLANGFELEMDREDLAELYSKLIRHADFDTAPVIGEKLSKLKGWDAPEISVNLNAETDIETFMNQIKIPDINKLGRIPLPSDYKLPE